MKVDERGFEDAIEAALLDGGYLKSVPSHFDPVLGLDTAELFAFIGATQVTQWESLLARYPNDPDAAQRGFAKRLASEIDHRGTVDVLRHGVVDLGVTIRGLLPAGPRAHPRTRSALPGQPGQRHPPAGLRAQFHQDPRPGPVGQRHPHGHRRAQEPAH